MKEFWFFDKDYFINFIYRRANINIYYSGHGKIGKIRCADFDVNYKEITKHILDQAND